MRHVDLWRSENGGRCFVTLVAMRSSDDEVQREKKELYLGGENLGRVLSDFLGLFTANDDEVQREWKNSSVESQTLEIKRLMARGRGGGGNLLDMLGANEDEVQREWKEPCLAGWNTRGAL